MARVSKTNPFRPRGQPVERSNTESENKDEEKSSSSSSSNSDKNTRDKKEEKAKGKRPVQAKSRKRKTPLYEIINGMLRAKGSVTKRGRGRGKSMAYTARLWSKYHPRIDVHISSDDEPNNVDPKPKSKQDDKHEKTRGKRPMQAKGMVTKRGRGKPTAYTSRLWSKHNTRSPSKKSNVDYLKVKEEDDVFSASETDSYEVCKRVNIERHNNDDTDNNGQGTEHIQI